MKRTLSKHTKKDDHTNFDFFAIDCVHVKNILLENQIDLHDDHLINYYLRLNHLTNIA